MNPAKAFVPQLRQNYNPFIFTSAKLGVRACEMEKVSECVRAYVGDGGGECGAREFEINCVPWEGA